MRLVTFAVGKKTSIGVLDAEGGYIVDLVKAAGAPADMVDFIGLGGKGVGLARAALKKAPKAARVPVKKARLLAPIPHPRRNIFCVGLNYQDHVREFQKSGFDASGKTNAPEYPIFFTKMPTAVIGPGATIPAHLDPTHSVDYENEFTVVIGKGGRDIKKKDAFKHIYGYTIVNDVTSRIQQKQYGQWFLGKSLDGFCPMGPWLVTADEIDDVRKLGLETRVNGELRQKNVVGDLIFDVPTLIETLSAGRTVEPGDLIATGTPTGVGIGFKPPKFLKKGDVVTLTIDKLGKLENKIG
ncbi:MAG: fumarylacetoacetate hydrolase family protein [Alphaproteobacteria bacterium]|nr:fumarylacetoacetate hydrolase family protein [Alphaproteobacteria bacterium]